MILYRKEPYPIQMKNVMLLDDVKSGGVVYVNKTTYDQALLLSGRLDGDPKRVLDILKSPKNEIYRTMLGLKGLMEEMMSSMPKPINMLAPFLIFCTQNQGIEWDANNRKFGYGVLHQFSQLVDFNAITLVPTEVRNNITVATTVLKEYQTSWDDLCSSLKDNVVLGAVQPVTQTVVPVQPVVPEAPVVPVPLTQPAPTSVPVPAATPTPASGEMSMEDKIKAFQEKMAREAEEEKKEREAKAAKRKAASDAKPATSTASKSSEAQAASAVLDEYDFD